MPKDKIDFVPVYFEPGKAPGPDEQLGLCIYCNSPFALVNGARYCPVHKFGPPAPNEALDRAWFGWPNPGKE